MQNSIWKLAVLAGVVGIGCLAVLQFQNKLWQQTDKAGSGLVSTDDSKQVGTATGDAETHPDTQLGAAADPDEAAFEFADTEPTAADPPESDPFPDPLLDSHDEHDDGGRSLGFDANVSSADHANSLQHTDPGATLAGQGRGTNSATEFDSNPQPGSPGLDFRGEESLFDDMPDPTGSMSGRSQQPYREADAYTQPDPFAPGADTASHAHNSDAADSDAGDEGDSAAGSGPPPYVRTSPDAEATQPVRGAIPSAIERVGHDEESPFDDERFPWDDTDSSDSPDAAAESDTPGPHELPELQPARDPELEPSGPQTDDANDAEPDGLFPEFDPAIDGPGMGPVKVPRSHTEDDSTENDDSPFAPQPVPQNESFDTLDDPLSDDESELKSAESHALPADERLGPADNEFDEDPFGDSDLHDRPAAGGRDEIEPPGAFEPGAPLGDRNEPAPVRQPGVPELGAFDRGTASDHEEHIDPPQAADPQAADPAPGTPELLPWDEPGDAASDTSDDASPPESDAPRLFNDSERAEPIDEPDLFDGSETDDSDRPKPLGPVPEAERVAPQPPLDLRGDGTVDAEDPRGRQTPQLSVEKAAPANAVLGQPLIYSIIVRNVGQVPAHQVVVEDRIPKGTQLKGTIPQAEMAGKRLIWKLGTLNSGEQKKISIRVVPFSAGRVGSVATVNFVSEVAAQTLITSPKLKVVVDGPEEVKLGETVLLEFQVTNTGDGEARGVMIRDLVPDGLTHPGGNDLEYELGRLAAGESRQIRLQLTAAKVGETVNHTIVSAAGGVSAEAKTPVEIYGSKLELARTGPKRRYVGRAAVYSNLLTNASDRPVEGVAVIEKISPGMAFVEASSGGQYDESTQTVAWRIGHLEPRAKRVLRIKLLPQQTGVQTSEVKAIAAGGTSVQASSQTEVAGFAAIGVEIPALTSPVDVGETVTFRVAAQNRGTVAARNVAVQIDVPAEMELLSARGPSQHVQNGNQIQFAPISSIDAKTRATFEVTLRARVQGDARIRVHVNSDHLSRALTREEAILVLGEAPPRTEPGDTVRQTGQP